MARILYGVSGEGSGHSSRSKEVISHLQKKHNIRVITYGKAYPYLKQYFPTTEIYGLRLQFKNNKVQYLGTLQHNIHNLFTSSQKFKALRALLKKFKPDIIVTDFEPTCYYLARIYGIPLISLDNQHRVTNLDLDIPARYKKDYRVCKGVINLIIPKADAYLITSFFTEKINKENTFLFPPILRQEVLKLKPTQGKHILVYQTSASNKRILKILRQTKESCAVYGFNQNKKDKNLVFKEFSTEGFLHDLASCKAVITNGGFTLITEALYLRKPLLCEPIQGQFEQIINAHYVDKVGCGMHRDKVTKQDLRTFLKNLETYKQNLQQYKQKSIRSLFNKIDELIKKGRSFKKKRNSKRIA